MASSRAGLWIRANGHFPKDLVGVLRAKPDDRDAWIRVNWFIDIRNSAPLLSGHVAWQLRVHHREVERG